MSLITSNLYFDFRNIRQIRRDPKIRRLKIKGEEHKLQASDDLVLLLENLEESIREIITTIENFGAVLGLKLNYEKNKFLTNNMTQEEAKKLEMETGFEHMSKIKYLGIHITKKTPSTLLKDNYLPILQKLETWGKLQLSLLGRIATVKMNILPKLLFLFQNLPILLNYNYLKEVDAVLSTFI